MKAPPDAALADKAASKAATKARRAARRGSGGGGGGESSGQRDFRRYTSPSGFAVLVVSRRAGAGAGKILRAPAARCAGYLPWV